MRPDATQWLTGEQPPMDAEEIIARYGLKPHPEGGHYRETFRAPSENGCRGAMTVIYYLLTAGEISAWHRIDAVEIWHYYSGDTLRLELSPDGIEITTRRLGMGDGAELHIAVPTGTWQSARSDGAWTLVGCTVAPAFEFAGFELAPPDWRPVKP